MPSPGLSNCKTCGGEVLWTHKQDGSWHPPLVSIGQVYVLNADNIPVHAEAVIRHRCDQADVERWEAFQARLADGRARQAAEARSAAEQRALDAAERREALKEIASQKEQAWRLAKKVDCPTCPAVRKSRRGGEWRCLNLVVLAGKKAPKGQGKYTSWPHPARTLLGESESH